MSEEINMKTFEKIVLITTPEYSAYMEKFVRSKVSLFYVTAGNLNNVASAVKCFRKYEPSRTLWLTHPEVFKIDCVEKSYLCMSCIKPLEIHVLPSTHSMTYSNYANEILSSFDELSKTVNSFLNAESSFAILPPFPPSFLPLEESEHDLHHKTDKDRKKYYFTTSSAILEFESLYAELIKQIIPFSLTEIEKMNITIRSIAEYFKVVKLWNSYLHIMQTDEVQSVEYTNSKYNQWFKHIDIFLTDTLKLSPSEYLSAKLSSKKTVVNLTSTLQKDSFACSEVRDDVSDILDEVSEPEIITLDSPTASPKPEKSNNPENYDHIVFICFCKEHAQLVPRKQELIMNTSIVIVKSSLNWCEERKKFDIFAKVYKTILFIIIGSINLLGTEYRELFCINKECAEPLLCLDFGQDSNEQIFNKAVNKYGQFIKNLRNYFKKLCTLFILTPMIPVKCTPKLDIANESSHQAIHKLLADRNTYLTVGESERWSTLSISFQMHHFTRMLNECHTLNEIEKFVNVLKENKCTSRPNICWVKLISIVDSDYAENEFKSFLKKFVYVLCALIKHTEKYSECSTHQNVEDKTKTSSTLTSTVPLIRQEKQILSEVNMDNTTLQLTSAVNSESTNTSCTSLEKAVSLNISAETVESPLTYNKEDEASTSTTIGLSHSIPVLIQGNNICLFKILTSSLVASAIVGPKGINILQLRINTKSQIEVSKAGVHYPGTSDQVCSISGSYDSVLTAVFLILDIVKDKLGDSSSTAHKILLQLKFVVPRRIVGKLIGTRGMVINKIIVESKALVHLCPDSKDFPPEESCFAVISNDVERMKAAFFMILEIINNDSQRKLQGITSSNVTIPQPSILQGITPFPELPPSMLQGIVTSSSVTAPSPSMLQGINTFPVLPSPMLQSITTSPNVIVPPPSMLHGITAYSDITAPSPSMLQRITPSLHVTAPPLSMPKFITSPDVIVPPLLMYQGTTTSFDITVPPPSMFQGITTFPDVTTPRPSMLQGITTSNVIVPPPSMLQGITAYSDITAPPPSMLHSITNSLDITVPLPSMFQDITTSRDITAPPSSMYQGITVFHDVNAPPPSMTQFITSPDVIVPPSLMCQGTTSSFDVTTPRPSMFQGITTSPDVTIPPPSIPQGITTSSHVTVLPPSVSQGITTSPDVTVPPPSIPQGITTSPDVTVPPPSIPQGITTSPDVTVPPPSIPQGITTSPDVTAPPPSIPQGINTSPDVTVPPPSIPQGITTSPDVTVPPPSVSQGITTSPDVTMSSPLMIQGITTSDFAVPPPSMTASIMQDSNNGNPFGTAVIQESYNWDNQSYEYQRTENNANYRVDNSQHDYPISSEYPSSYAASNSLVSSSQEASEYPLERKEGSDREIGNQVERRYPTGDKQNYRSQSNDSGYECHSLDSRQRFNYRSRSPSHVRKRRRSYSRSRSRSNRSSTASPNRKCQSISEIGDEVSLSDAIDLLENVCDRCGALSETIKKFTATVKSALEIDRTKALRLIKGDNILLGMIVNELKSYIASAPIEEIGLLSKAVECTNNLIKCAEKTKEPERNINLRAIAVASLNKTPNFVLKLIKSALLYERKSNPSSEDIREAFFKVSSLQCEMVLNDNFDPS